MFVFIKKVFHIGSLFSSSLVSTTPLSCILMNNQACKVRPEIVDANSNEIGYIPIKKIDDCENIYSVNPLYLLVNYANGYIEEKRGE